MRGFILKTLALLTVVAASAGCQNVSRIGCECKMFYLDVQRNLFGIDYPGNAPESYRPKYYGIPDPGNQPVCDDY